MTARRTFATAALALTLGTTGCAEMNKEQAGALVGAIIGAAVGSAFGDGSGRAVAALVGGVAGGLIGAAIGAELDEADRIKAANAAQLAAAAPDGARVTWRSDKNPKTFGYAEPIGPTYSGSSTPSPSTTYCYDPKIDLAYRGSHQGCVGADDQISAEEFEAHWQRKREDDASPGQRFASSADNSTHCYDAKLGAVYRTSTPHCFGADRLISQAEFERHRNAEAANGAPAAASIPVAQTFDLPAARCRKVREVYFINGSERSEQAEYCWRGTSWERA